jgi:sigma-E factor negative regulatory protein RseC
VITETGRVVAVEADSLWVETIRRSTCNSCSAQKACGHGLMNKMDSGRQHHVRALLDGQSADDFNLDDEVEISITEQVLVVGALVVYMLPLLLMLAGAIITAQFLTGDVAAFAGSVVGLSVGLAIVRYHSYCTRNQRQFQPLVVANNTRSVSAIETSALSTAP